MRRPRRRLLPVLLLLLTTAFGASAVTLSRRDSLDASPGWGAEDVYYKKSDGHYCQKCPAGTYIAEECKEQNGSGECRPCGYGEYMEYPNAFQWCRDCSKCREDQVEQSPCQPLRNTVCACRNGTFCPPEHPCEMCQKCRPRCPEGQVVLRPCRPDSDLQCGPAADTVPAYLAVIVGVVAFVVVFVVAFCSWKHCCSSTGDGTPSSRRPYKMVSSMFRKMAWYRRVNVGAEDNAANAHLQQRHAEAQVMLQSGSGSPRILVPASGSDPIAGKCWGPGPVLGLRFVPVLGLRFLPQLPLPSPVS
ncbi:tumor necrosis factor receptor superfamily member 26-like isoform X2 [Prinia subflava]|uniref:tumor necrosis factor receptor superfamily member 26-like isoform X2 n=1 Tax=Prinia subflava TaxID=208062 RepID=UPI002FDF7D97